MNNRFIDFKKQLGKFIANFSNVVEQDGKSYIYDDLNDGSVVSTYDEKGDVIPLETGSYKIGESEIYVVDGKVSQKPDPTPANDPVNDPQPQNDPVDDKDTTIANLTSEIETLKAENDAMKAELETLRKQPLVDPVPQRTTPTPATSPVNDDVKGTKYEAACRIFGSK